MVLPLSSGIPFLLSLINTLLASSGLPASTKVIPAATLALNGKSSAKSFIVKFSCNPVPPL
jgi:hypothetical protein